MSTVIRDFLGWETNGSQLAAGCTTLETWVTRSSHPTLNVALETMRDSYVAVIRRTRGAIAFTY